MTSTDKPVDKDRQLTVRFPEEWHREADELVRKLSAPGARLCKTDVVRMAIREGLDALKRKRR